MIEELGQLSRANVIIAAEDTIEFDTPFSGRFGFSALLELAAGSEEKHVLFDTNSASEPILRNLGILGKSLGQVTTIFLSHCHYDHADGLPGILDAVKRPIQVVAHPEVFRPCFEINRDGVRHIGIVRPGRAELEQKGAVFAFSRGPVRLMTGAITTGEIPRTTSFEPLEDLYTISEGIVVQDHERDDSAVVLNLESGLVIVTGCCHAGIVNTISHVKKITGIEKIHAVIGGLHLIGASEEKVQRSVEALREVDHVFAGHCTGFDGLRRIASAMGGRFHPIHTGSVISLPIQDSSEPVRTIPTLLRGVHRY